MNHKQGSFQGVGDLEIFYQFWTPDGESKASIAIVHGIGEHSGRYMNAVNHFVPGGYTVFGMDHRGHGRSQGRRGHIMNWSEFREDVHTFIGLVQKASINKPVFMMGHSLGGLITLDYCLHYPQGIKAVIVSSPALVKPGVPAILLSLSKLMSKIWPALAIETKLDFAGISRDQEVVRAYKEDPLVHGKASARLGTEFEICRQHTLNDAGKFNLPLLIYHGTEDRIVSHEGSEAFYNLMTERDKEFHLLEGGFHESHNDIDKEKVFSLIEIWIEKHL